jgi:hypothetical protein
LRRSPPPKPCAQLDEPQVDEPQLDESGAMTRRRQLTLAIVACVVAAALVLLATSRTWTVVVTERPAPLGPVRQARSGAALYPWLPALGLAALAGAVAVPATRGWGRVAVGAVLALCGLGVVAGAVTGIARGVPVGWPLLCGLGGFAVAGAGAVTVARGRTWPAMGSRYERASSRPAPRAAETDGRAAETDGPAPPAGLTDAQVWDAIDRGEDPTR